MTNTKIHEDESDYTTLAQKLADQYARNFHWAPESMEAEFNDTRPRIQQQRTSIQPTNDLTGLSPEEADEVTELWKEQASSSALDYCSERNAGRTGKAVDKTDPIVQEVKAALERRRRRGWHKKQV
jgi:hypothetical protein